MQISPDTVSPDVRAIARYDLARAILAAGNTEAILTALAVYGKAAACTAVRREQQGHDGSAHAWTKVAEELATVLACADLNRGGGDV